ncbi:MAG: class I SAM-dependent methyltransferase [Candidatus Roizmanbacteria bacterium]
MGFFIIFIVIIIIFLFSSPKLSPIPYFPSNKKDLPLIIKSLDLKNNQNVIDLGAGDGIVIFEAAKQAFRKKLNTQFIAVDINPILVFIMFLRRLFHPNKKNIKIILGDIFKNDFMNFINFKNFITIYLYISPWFLEKVIENCKLALNKVEGLKIENLRIVSYMYPIKSLKNKEKIIEGKNKIFIY